MKHAPHVCLCLVILTRGAGAQVCNISQSTETLVEAVMLVFV